MVTKTLVTLESTGFNLVFLSLVSVVFNFPIMVIASAAFVTRSSTQQSCWTCLPQGSYLPYLSQQYRFAAHLHTFYHFFFNNSVCFYFSKYHH